MEEDIAWHMGVHSKGTYTHTHTQWTYDGSAIGMIIAHCTSDRNLQKLQENQLLTIMTVCAKHAQSWRCGVCHLPNKKDTLKPITLIYLCLPSNRLITPRSIAPGAAAPKAPWKHIRMEKQQILTSCPCSLLFQLLFPRQRNRKDVVNSKARLLLDLIGRFGQNRH